MGRAVVVVLATQAAHAAGPGNGDEEDLAQAYGDKSFVTIATGSRTSLTRAPAVATVITAADIQAIGATDFDDVLQTVPGLTVTHLLLPRHDLGGSS